MKSKTRTIAGHTRAVALNLPFPINNRQFCGYMSRDECLLPEGHAQRYTIQCGFGQAIDGTVGWIFTISLRVGNRSFLIARTRGSAPKSNARISDETFAVCHNRRAHRHAQRLGIQI